MASLALAAVPAGLAQTVSAGLSTNADVTSFDVRGRSELDLTCSGSFSAGWNGSIRDGETLTIPLAQGTLRADVRFTNMGVRDSAGGTLPTNPSDWSLNGWAPDAPSGDAVRFEGSASALSGDVVITLDAGFSLTCGGASWQNGAGRFFLGGGSSGDSERDENAPASLELNAACHGTLRYEAIRWVGGDSAVWSSPGNWSVGSVPMATGAAGVPGYPVISESGSLVVADRDLNGLNWFDRARGTLFVFTDRTFFGENVLQGNGMLLLDGAGARLTVGSLQLGEGFLVGLNGGASLTTTPAATIEGLGTIDLAGTDSGGASRLITDGVGAGIEVTAAAAEIEPATRFGQFRNAGFITQAGAGTSLRVFATVLNPGDLIQRGEAGLLQVNGLVNSGYVRVERGLLRCTGVNNTGAVLVDSEGTLRTTGFDQSAGTTQLGGILLVDTTGGNRLVTVTGGTFCGAGRVAATGPGRVTVDLGDGVICPGSSPGQLAIEGDLVCRSGAVLDLELAGPKPQEADQLRVDGAVDLGGTIRVTLLDGYRPKPGTTWDLVTSSAGFRGTLPRVEFANDFVVRHSLGIHQQGKKGASVLRMKFLGGRFKG